MQQLPSLHDRALSLLKKSKNLLAFSGGIDSSALFFILMEHGIDFDISIIDYNLRDQSKEEVEYAKKLCSKYNKKIFLHECRLDDSNFESNARAERYGFFEKIIKEHGYSTLITAHHLNDRLEWFLMQLGKGSGLVEMMGFDEIEERDSYKIIRPLSHVSKNRLQDFLEKNKILYFIDESNKSYKYARNRIRHRYANAFTEEFENGLTKSFDYLMDDARTLLPKNAVNIKELFISKKEQEDTKNIRQIDRIVKKLGLLMSSAQRKEVLNTKDCVVSRKIAVVFTDELIYISPFKKSDMPKEFKELCRRNKIPPKIRPYIYGSDIDIPTLKELSCKLLS